MEGVTHDSEKSIHQSEREDTKQTPTRAEPGEVQPGANAQTQRVEDPDTGM